MEKAITWVKMILLTRQQHDFGAIGVSLENRVRHFCCCMVEDTLILENVTRLT